MHELKQIIITKLTSGRWILTVAGAVTFVVMSITSKLDPTDVKELIMLIATFYFAQRAVEKQKSANDNEG